MARPPLVVALIAVLAAAAGCGQVAGKAPVAAPPTTPPSTTIPATTTTPPTTVYQPPTTGSSPDDASTLLIEAWAAGSRAEAARIASPGAVASLFAVSYPGDQLQGRGCSDVISPADCDYRDGNALIKVYTSRLPQGWYVSSVVVEN